MSSSPPLSKSELDGRDSQKEGKENEGERGTDEEREREQGERERREREDIEKERRGEERCVCV